MPAGAQNRVIAYVDHTVQSGDTVFAIALQYGSTVPRIVRDNGIRDVRRLMVGSRLRIPVVSAPNPGAAARVRRSALPAPPQQPSAAPVEVLLSRANAELKRARFQEALNISEEALEPLSALSSRRARPLRARLETIRATAHVALDDSEAARECLERALRADPEFTLDPETTPPKLMAVFYLAEQSLAPR
jgi:murein DD-endopeptidase MepM/ murein hydrolase activator NlpD